MTVREKSHRLYFALNILVPLFIGTAIYVWLRPDATLSRLVIDLAGISSMMTTIGSALPAITPDQTPLLIAALHALATFLPADLIRTLRNFGSDLLWAYALTATEYTTDSIWGDVIKLRIENNSDADVGVGCTALIVNNYNISDLFASTIAAGKKANETLYFSSSELKAAGIETIGQVEVYFHLYNPDDFSSFYDADVATIQTSAFADMDTAPNDAGEELFNQDGIRIVGKYTDENSFWGTSILLYIENTSGTNVTVACDNMSINGYMVSPLFSSTVYNNKMALSAITIFSSDLEDNDITTVQDVELTFRIYDADKFSTIVESDPIMFTVK